MRIDSGAFERPLVLPAYGAVACGGYRLEAGSRQVRAGPRRGAWRTLPCVRCSRARAVRDVCVTRDRVVAVSRSGSGLL